MQISNLLNRLRDNRLALGILIAFVFLIATTLVFLLSGRSPSKKSPEPMNSPLDEYEHGTEIEEPLEEMKGFIKKESLSDGTVRYIFNNPSYLINTNSQKRESIVVADSANNVIFERALTDPSFPVKLTDYTEPYGPSRHVYKGSYNYGSGSNTYIYPELGLAFIGDPKQNIVFEQHLFTPIGADDYVGKYGDDIIGK